jgi:hypothetical protein
MVAVDVPYVEQVLAEPTVVTDAPETSLSGPLRKGE